MTIDGNRWESAREPSNTARLKPLESPVTVAAIIPAHNEESTIVDTVRSCLHQTYAIEQLIVIADNCTDATADRAFQAGAIVIEGKAGCKAAVPGYGVGAEGYPRAVGTPCVGSGNRFAPAALSLRGD